METNDLIKSWVEEEAPKEVMPSAKLAEVMKKAAVLRKRIERADRILKLRKEKFEEVSNTILRTLDLMQIESMKAHGYLFYKDNRMTVSAPKTAEEKEELFEYLKREGIFLEVASVSSQTLNALYREMSQAAKLEAEEKGQTAFEFKMPGVKEPTTFTTLKLRRA